MKHIIIAGILGCIILVSCEKMEKIDPAFSVTAAKTTYKVGEPVNFAISGNPANLTFFSGERGKRFEFLNRVNADGTPRLQFTSLAANGTQTNSLALMVSDDFKGIGANEAATAANIAAATWKDITSRAALSTGATTTSGAIDLTDIATVNKPVYIAFRYRGVAGSIQRRWTITALTVTNSLADGTVYTLANLNNTAITNYGVTSTTSPGWSPAKVSNSYGWTVSGGSSLAITGATTAAAATADAEAWVFAGLIDLKRVTPDLGVSIKNISTRLESYTYTYPQAGTYTATFQGISRTVYDSTGEIQQVQLTITP